MDAYSIDFLVLVLLTVAAFIATLCIFYGIFSSATWFFYPESHSVVGEFFKYNYYLRKAFGFCGVRIINIIFNIAIVVIVFFAWRDLYIRSV